MQSRLLKKISRETKFSSVLPRNKKMPPQNRCSMGLRGQWGRILLTDRKLASEPLADLEDLRGGEARHRAVRIAG